MDKSGEGEVYYVLEIDYVKQGKELEKYLQIILFFFFNYLMKIESRKDSEFFKIVLLFIILKIYLLFIKFKLNVWFYFGQ